MKVLHQTSVLITTIYTGQTLLSSMLYHLMGLLSIISKQLDLESKIKVDNKQVDSVCKKGKQYFILFLKRNIHSCKHEIKFNAYYLYSYARPILEYAVCCWAPYTKHNFDKLELVQRRAARFVMKDYHPTSSVTVMINKLKWSSLRHRRDTIRLQMMYKITHQLVDLKLPDYIAYNHGTTRGHNYKLTILYLQGYRFIQV